MKRMMKSFGTFLKAIGQTSKLTLDESCFAGVDINKHNYLKDVINKILSQDGEVRTGKDGGGKPVTGADYDLEKLQDLLETPNVTPANFDACAKNKNAKWTNIFKGDFSGASGIDKVSGTVKTFGSGATMTAIQESITAVILELKCNKTPIAVSDDALREAKTKEAAPIIKWLLASKPSENSGICKYINFPKMTDDDFFIAMSSFIKDWGSSIEKVYNADIRGLVNSIFKHGIAAKTWHFGHFGRKDMTNIPELKSYLANDRAGMQKDMVDKSDIVLFFNANEAKAIMRKAMTAKTIEEHNAILNEAFINKKLLGISLKQIGGQFNLIGVNFNKALTNAANDEINADKIAAVVCNTKNTKENTFTPNSISEIKYAETSTGKLFITVNNKKSIHINNLLQLDFRTKGSPRIAVIIYEKGAKAYMGNGKNSFSKETINGLPALNFDIAMIEKMHAGEPTNEIINLVMNRFAALLKSKDGVKRFSLAFADAVGYSFVSDDVFTQVSAPYIKIY